MKLKHLLAFWTSQSCNMQKIFIINKLLFFRVWWAVVFVKKDPQGLEKTIRNLKIKYQVRDVFGIIEFC